MKRSTVPSWAPFETRFGTGWIGWDGSGRVETRLPGGAAPAVEAAEPPAYVTRLAREVADYFAGRRPLPAARDLLAGLHLSPLDRRIYQVVSAIPAGSTLTYSEVARRVRRPGAARAVGSAMARNRLAPIVPCHRVVGSDGSLRGYGGGLSMKQSLLKMEAGSDA